MASTMGATGAAPWTIDGRCVSSKSSACDCAPLASAAWRALVRSPRPTTVACGNPPLAVITDARAAASGSAAPRTAVPNQSVIERFAASITAGGSDAVSRPRTKSTSASITGVCPSCIVRLLLAVSAYAHDAAVHAQHLAGHVAGPGRGEQNDRGRDVLGTAQAAHRVRLFPPLDLLGREHPAEQRRVHRRGRHDIHRDAVPRHL